VSIADAARGIAAMPLPSMRTSWESLGCATLINDAYNASPASMKAALELLDGLGSDRQRVAVLGTMRELGTHAERLHAEIAQRALRSSIEVLAGVGEMERLVGIVEPDISVVTCIAEEHLEGLGDMEGVMREESFIFDGARVAIVPASQPEVARAARGRAGRVVTAGLGEGELRAERWGLEPDGHGWLEIEGVRVCPRVRGAHNLRNAMLALAVARECGVSLADAARGVESAEGPAMRTAWEQLGRVTLINDAYNASPASMRAALELLGGLPGGRQRVAVLGTMRELGSHSARLHDELAREALGSSIEVIAGAGEMGLALHRVGAGDPRLVVAEDIHDLWTALEPRLASDAVILLKASRGVELERLVPSITAWANS
jgi:UDP-N-acetylmuramoyl-tripeptide--D-alanyl-D-alanine ligase